MSAVTPAVFDYIKDLVYRRAAIVLEPGKEYLVEARLLPVARDEKLATLEDLVARVRREEKGRLGTLVVEAMTTNETSFFRDSHPFEALTERIIPDMLKARAATRTLKIWCAAASTGQEPYSIAMLLKEKFPQLETWSVQIVATDLNAAVIARARTGIYKQLEVNRGLPAPLLVKYFDREGPDWRIKPALRQMVSYSELNLLDRWQIGQQDVVFMRNVLIYFDLPTKRTIFGQVRQVLRPDGFLLLGGAETTLNIDDNYGTVRVGRTVVYQPRGG